MVTVIINPISGRRRGPAGARADLARTLFAGRGEEVVVVVSERRGHIRELATAAAGAGARLVLVWGGDGAFNEAGSALMGGPIPLGIIPAGSGNGLARELGIPRDPARAVAHALAARPRTLDAGLLGGRPFFNLAGIGFDARIAARFDAAARRGFSTYLRMSAQELLRYQPARYRIEVGSPSAGAGQTAVPRAAEPGRRALLVTIANSAQFGNGARIAPSARVDDGRLDLVVYEESSRVRTICAVPWLFLGQVERVRGLTVRQIERARIESDDPMGFHVDGEPAEGGHVLEARVLPAALRLCA